ncbi:alpha/beta hydrolase [Cryobacterium sp. TMT2-23]|uniref:alpha/beta hydrolase n=1 Tax=Cryobacterium sp. TMT2-23 TaxID=1259252 RepID=UPI00210414E5|nr:alpha/beta hydrolase [Cryobacterium sp. TMT2-23]
MEFTVEGSAIRGTFYPPAGVSGPWPVIVMAHGWGMVSGGDLEDYASAVVSKGFAALTFDFRNLGASDGEPRQEIDPHRQIEDYRAAISYVRTRSDVDGDRIGIWGSSYSGGHALVVAAIDRRVRCVVAQVPTISGWRAAQLKASMGDLAAQQQWFEQDREARFAGSPSQLIPMISPIPGEKVAYPGSDSYEYMSGQGDICPTWRNEITVKSLELARTYEPGAFIDRIAPTPLLMIAADRDTVTPTALQQEAYERAHHPKRLLLVPGDHYSVYTEHFEATRAAAVDWFSRHLTSAGDRHWSDATPISEREPSR